MAERLETTAGRVRSTILRMTAIIILLNVDQGSFLLYRYAVSVLSGYRVLHNFNELSMMLRNFR